MVEFRNQHALVFFGSPARRDIDGNAHHPLRAAVAAVRNETAPLDPPYLAGGAGNAILDAVFPPLLTENAAPQLVHAPQILGVHSGPPFAARGAAAPLGQAMNGCEAL